MNEVQRFSSIILPVLEIRIDTFISFPDLSFPDNMSSRKFSTILIVIFGPKSDTKRAWNQINKQIKDIN